MSARQKRRQKWGRLKAKAEGRSWITGATTITFPSGETVQASNKRLARSNAFTLPDTGAIQMAEDKGLALAKRAARGSAIWQSVKLVDMPVAATSTFRMRDL